MLPVDPNFWQIFQKGGPMMWPILLCSVVALAIAVERVSYYLSSAEDVSRLRKDLFDALKRGDRDEALRLCDMARPFAGRIFKAGLLQSGDSREEIVHAMEQEAQAEVPSFEKWLPALSVIANVSPLLGFLGTAIGLASSFFLVQSSTLPLNAVSLSYFSSGVWQALLTTIAGLFVGISSTLVYNVCVIWANRTVLTLEREATEFANLLSYLSETALNQDVDRGLPEEP